MNNPAATAAENASSADTEDAGSLTESFVGSNADYYERQFQLVGSKSSFTWTFNTAAAVLGPVWYGMRGIWNWSFAFVILEAFACVQIGRGFWGDLAAGERDRLSSVEAQIGLRQDQLDAALKRGDANVDVFERNIQSLQDILSDIQLDIQQAADSRIWIIVLGIGMLLAVKVLQGVLANTLLERRYSEWLSDRTIKSGVPVSRVASSVLFAVPVYVASIIHYTVPGLIPALADFPTDRQIRLVGIEWIEAFFDYIIIAGETFFDAIAYGIRWVLDSLELLLVQSPWIIIIVFLVTLTGLSAGPRAASGRVHSSSTRGWSDCGKRQ